MTNLEKIQSVLSEFNSDFISRHSKELSEALRPDIIRLWKEELEEYLSKIGE